MIRILRIKEEEVNDTSRIVSLIILLYLLYCVSCEFLHVILIICELMYNNIIHSCVWLVFLYIVLNESYRYGDRNPMDDLMMIIYVPLEIICRIIYFIVDPIFSLIGFN